MTDESIFSRKAVQVFTAPGLEGTSAVIFQTQELDNTQELQRIATQEAAPATCFYKRLSDDIYQVRFFNASNEIQLCGHGILATARVIAEQGGKNFTFIANQSKVQANYDRTENDVWIIFEELEVIASETPSWVDTVFNTSPISVFKAGPDDGYWVMEWPRSYDLNSLLVDFEALKKLTQRAVIATQESECNEHDYYFRYFAPQHGVLEDKATGSAHRVLVSYWGQRLNKCNVLARQLSNEGAELKGRYDNGDVWISGNVFIRS